VFLKWWLTKSKCEEESKKLGELRAFKVGKVPTVTVEDLYTTGQLDAIFKACSSTRDLAIMKVLYESAFRASELLSVTFERVEYLPDGTAEVIVNGKTGTRKITLCGSVPALRNWVNVHPVGHGPIWVTTRKPIVPLTYSGLHEVVSHVVNIAGLEVTKKRLIHLFRHSRITELRKLGITGVFLQQFVGWSGNDMEKVYEHLSPEDVNNEIRQKVYGLGPITQAPAPLLYSRKCPRCSHENDQRAVVCESCNFPLSNDLIVQHLTEKTLLEEKVESLEKRSDKLEYIIRTLATNAGVTPEELEFALGPSPPLWEGVSEGELEPVRDSSKSKK